MRHSRKRRRRKPLRDDRPVLVDDDILSSDPLVRMCLRGNDINAIRFVVDMGNESVDTKDPKTGRTPLMVSCIMRNVPLVRFLLCRGALIHQRDHEGNTALDHAIISGCVLTEKLLLASGASTAFLNGQTLTNDEYSSIYDVVLSGDVEEARARFERCEDLPTARDNAGRTLLKMLLDDSNQKNSWTEEMVSVLTSFGAKTVSLVYHEV